MSMAEESEAKGAIPLEARPKLGAKVRMQVDKISGQPALLYPEGLLLLNPTGAEIVTLSDGTHTFQEIVAILAERYNVTAEELGPDIAEYLRELHDRVLCSW